MKNLILILRMGVGFLTKAEQEAMEEIVGDEDSLAVGTPLTGPNVPIPINRDGHMISILQTHKSAEEVSKILSEANDFLPAICIDITDQIENIEDGKIAINDQMFKSTGLGSLMVDVFDLEPQGHYDEKAHEEEKEKKKSKLEELKARIKEEREKGDHDDEDCDCPACELRRAIFKDGDIEGIKDVGDGVAVDGIEGLQKLFDRLKSIDGLKDKLEEFEKSRAEQEEAKKSIKYKRKTCRLNLNQLLDLVSEKGFDNLSDAEKARLNELSKGSS